MSDELDEPKMMLTPEQAIALLPDGDTIHTFMNPGGMLLGADWGRDKILELIATTIQREIGGPQCRAMKHGLVCWKDKFTPIYIETAPDDVLDVQVVCEVESNPPAA